MRKNTSDMQEIDSAAYLEGKLSGSAREEFDRLIQADAEARDRLALARRVFDDRDDAGDAPARLVNEAVGRYAKAPDILDIVVALAGKAVEIVSSSADAVIAAPTAALAFRGGEPAAYPLITVSKLFNRARVDVHIENLGRNLCQFTVLASDPARDGPLENGRVDLVSGWRELASNPLEEGRTQFEDVVPGRYDLIVKKNDAVIGRMTIKIAGA